MSDKVLYALKMHGESIDDREELKAGLWYPVDNKEGGEWCMRLLVLELGHHHNDPAEGVDEFHVMALGPWGDSVLGKGIWVKGSTFHEVGMAFRCPAEAYKMTEDLSKHFSIHGSP